MRIEEKRIGEAVVSYLVNLEWDVYQEVGLLGSVADIVAVHEGVVWIIECKSSANLAVIDQAYNYRGCAHRVSVATPLSKNRIFSEVCRHFELGWLRVGSQTHKYRRGGITYLDDPNAVADILPVRETVQPPSRIKVIDIKHLLHEKQKTMCGAGSAHGGHWTPFKETCEAVAKYVAQHPGSFIVDVVDNVPHHYRTKYSARASLAHWIRQGKVLGVKIEGGSLWPNST